MTRPIALTMGDPAGIGPEIALKAWQELGSDLAFVAIGDADTWEPLARDHGIRTARLTEVGEPSPDHFTILHRPLNVPPVPGSPDAKNAEAIVGYIREGANLVRDGAYSALVTNPISKDVLIGGADFAFPGHTEFLAHIDDAPRPVMMLAGEALKVVPVTIHVPLSDVPAILTQDLLRDTIEVTHAALIRDFGRTDPVLAVAGLNPHAGENGRMGREEIDVIAPVVSRLKTQGMRLLGPMSGDTMFHEAARARYDTAICMYHDQALIPLKTISFSDGVNVTLGLSFVRTSPDHGTAFDIAGKNVADPQSLISAMKLASQMAARRR